MSDAAPLAPKGKCPICGKPVSPEFRPFCSARCKQVDLNRWFTESYRVPEKPGEEAPASGSGDAEDDE